MAEFWIVWSFWIIAGEALGNQMMVTYMKRDEMRDL